MSEVDRMIVIFTCGHLIVLSWMIYVRVDNIWKLIKPRPGFELPKPPSKRR